MREGICYICGAADFTPAGFAPGEGDFVIAADGGYAHLRRNAIDADLVVGDFDSLGHVPLHPHVVRLPAEKDETDLVAAVKQGLVRGYRTFLLYGALGGQQDHTLASLQTVVWLSRHGAAGYLIGADLMVTAVTNGSLFFDAACRGTISVFCSGDEAQGVYLRGLYYPLSDARLTDDVPLGVSNAFTGEEAEVRVEAGSLLVLWKGNPEQIPRRTE